MMGMIIIMICQRVQCIQCENAMFFKNVLIKCRSRRFKEQPMNTLFTLFLCVALTSAQTLCLDVPCICDLNMNCATGQTDSLFVPNIPPIPATGIASVLLITQPIVLNASSSLDVYWKIFSTPYDPNPSPIFFSDPNVGTQIIHTMGLQPGNYSFILYVSDHQIVTYALWNTTLLSQ